MRGVPTASIRKAMHRTALSIAFFVLLSASAPTLRAQNVKLLVTVFDEKTGDSIADLRAENFSVVDGETRLRVLSAERKQRTLDVLLMADASMLGGTIRPLVAPVIDELGERDQMALVLYHESADLAQDFTSDKQRLLDAFTRFQYGGNPRAIDALYAGLDGGLTATSAAPVVLLLTSGVEGRSRTGLAEVRQLARRRTAPIHVVYYEGVDSRMFRRIALSAGGSYFHAKKLKLEPDELAKKVFEAMRGVYELELSGVYTLGDRIEVEIVGLPKSKRKIRAGALPVD